MYLIQYKKLAQFIELKAVCLTLNRPIICNLNTLWLSQYIVAISIHVCGVTCSCHQSYLNSTIL